MVVVKQGELKPPGKHYRVYLNADRKRNKWYLRVTHSFPHTNRHFRAGTYDSKEEAMKAAETLDPVHPKKGRSKPGTVDRYSNGMWRVRVKYKGEHMHVGYYKDEQEAQIRLREALANPPYLEERYQSLLEKRRRKEVQKKHKKRKLEDSFGFGSMAHLAKKSLYSRRSIISPLGEPSRTGSLMPSYQHATAFPPSTFPQYHWGGYQDFNPFSYRYTQTPQVQPSLSTYVPTFVKKEENTNLLSWCDPLPHATAATANYTAPSASKLFANLLEESRKLKVENRTLKEENAKYHKLEETKQTMGLPFPNQTINPYLPQPATESLQFPKLVSNAPQVLPAYNSSFNTKIQPKKEALSAFPAAPTPGNFHNSFLQLSNWNPTPRTQTSSNTSYQGYNQMLKTAQMQNAQLFPDYN